MNDSSVSNPRLKIDIHVHLVGDDSSGSGCRINLQGMWYKLLARFMIHHLGLPQGSLSGNMDRLYLELLIKSVRESSLDRAVILAMDDLHDEEGVAYPGSGTFFVPNDYVLKLSQQHPDLFLPGVSIHPARKDAIETLEYALSEGAVLMKYLPASQDINFNLPRYKPFWKKMAEAGLPLLSHTGGEHTIKVVRPEYKSPQILKGPLECGVTCIAAHSGSQSGLFDTDYLEELIRMMEIYPHLYADSSAFNIPFRAKLLKSLRARPLIRERILHGSDYPVPVFGHWAWISGAIDHHAFQSARKIKNPLECDFFIKKSAGWPEEHFTRAGSILRKTQAN